MSTARCIMVLWLENGTQNYYDPELTKEKHS